MQRDAFSVTTNLQVKTPLRLKLFPKQLRHRPQSNRVDEPEAKKGNLRLGDHEGTQAALHAEHASHSMQRMDRKRSRLGSAIREDGVQQPSSLCIPCTHTCMHALMYDIDYMSMLQKGK